MIRYDLLCDSGHGFDVWFRSSSDYDVQAERGLLSCPVCGDGRVRKALMAPALSSRSAPAADKAEAAAPVGSGEVALVEETDQKLRSLLRELRRHVNETSEDVGERFPEVARKMHSEEIERRSIRGRASAEEARALVEEGVAIQPLPQFPDDVN
ncbi:MAG TPA: DUF1178 family protein [Hansschlegelia sp.]